MSNENSQPFDGKSSFIMLDQYVFRSILKFLDIRDALKCAMTTKNFAFAIPWIKQRLVITDNTVDPPYVDDIRYLEVFGIRKNPRIFMEILTKLDLNRIVELSIKSSILEVLPSEHFVLSGLRSLSLCNVVCCRSLLSDFIVRSASTIESLYLEATDILDIHVGTMLDGLSNLRTLDVCRQFGMQYASILMQNIEYLKWTHSDVSIIDLTAKTSYLNLISCDVSYTDIESDCLELIVRYSMRLRSIRAQSCRRLGSTLMLYSNTLQDVNITDSTEIMYIIASCHELIGFHCKSVNKLTAICIDCPKLKKLNFNGLKELKYIEMDPNLSIELSLVDCSVLGDIDAMTKDQFNALLTHYLNGFPNGNFHFIEKNQKIDRNRMIDTLITILNRYSNKSTIKRKLSRCFLEKILLSSLT